MVHNVTPEGIEEARKTFLPTLEEWNEPPVRLIQKVNVPIQRAPVRHGMDKNGRPFFELLATSWELDVRPYTKEEFEVDLEGALLSLTQYINETGKPFLVYPISSVPEVKYGVAYHDWRGLSYPFDMRAVVALNGGKLAFHLTMLIPTNEA